MTLPEWMKDILDNDKIIAKFQLQGERLDEYIKSQRTNELANKIADLVVKKLNKTEFYLKKEVLRMSMNSFINLCKTEITKENYPCKVNLKDIFVVWSCKTLQNKKALLATDLSNDGNYYEFTYNGDKKELYMDKYKHIGNRAINVNK